MNKRHSQPTATLQGGSGAPDTLTWLSPSFWFLASVLHWLSLPRTHRAWRSISADRAGQPRRAQSTGGTKKTPSTACSRCFPLREQRERHGGPMVKPDALRETQSGRTCSRSQSQQGASSRSRKSWNPGLLTPNSAFATAPPCNLSPRCEGD